MTIPGGRANRIITDPNTGRFLFLIDTLRARLPSMSAADVWEVERQLPGMITDATKANLPAHRQALEVLARDIQMLRDGVIARDEAAVDEDLMNRMQWMIDHATGADRADRADPMVSAPGPPPTPPPPFPSKASVKVGAVVRYLWNRRRK